MELRSLAIWRLWMGGRDDPYFQVAQLQICGSVAAGICLDEHEEGGSGLLTPVSLRTRPPLWRGSLGWLSGQARDRYDRAADKGQAACWEQRCSPTQTRLLLSSLDLQWDPQLAAEKPPPMCTESNAVNHWLFNNANHCCMVGPPKHKHRKSNAALTVWQWQKAPCLSETSNSAGTRVLSSVLGLFIMSTSLGTLIFLSTIPKQTPPNCYQVCVETVWAERRR